MQSKCQEVWIRFASPNHHAQHISVGMGGTRAHHLLVEQTTDRLSVSYCDKEGDCIKSINYNYAHILEWSTEGWVK